MNDQFLAVLSALHLTTIRKALFPDGEGVPDLARNAGGAEFPDEGAVIGEEG